MKIGPNLYGEGEVGIDYMIVKYSQCADCTEDQDTEQTLKITSRHNGTDYFHYIQTDGWSFGDGEDLSKLVDDFDKRLKMFSK
jgi:hypothetical protein